MTSKMEKIPIKKNYSSQGSFHLPQNRRKITEGKKRVFLFCFRKTCVASVKTQRENDSDDSYKM